MSSETKPIRTMREISFIDWSPDFQQTVVNTQGVTIAISLRCHEAELMEQD